MLGMPWTEHVSLEGALSIIETTKKVILAIRKRHKMRKDDLENLTLRLMAKKNRGKQPVTYLKCIKVW